MGEVINKKYLQQLAEDTARDIRSKIDEVHGPYWQSRADLAKLIISLSSVILVGTITFSSSLIDSSGSTSYPSLLITSWSLILLALFSGIMAVWFNAILFSFHPRFINLGPKLDKQLDELSPESDTLVDDILAAVKNISDVSLEPVGKADKRSYWALVCSLVFFGLGLLIFIVFGALQLCSAT